MASFALIIQMWTIILPSAYTFFGVQHGVEDNPLDETSNMIEILEEVNRQLNSNLTRDFLSTFNTSLERQMVYKQLEFCPYVNLCEYKLQNIVLPPWNQDYIACCYGCRCDFPSCLNDSSCCLDIVLRNSVMVEGLPWSFRSPETCLSRSVLEDSSYGFIMKLSGCPVNTDEELARNCTSSNAISLDNFEEIEEFVPVYDNVTLDVYKNKYCAYCNGIFHIKKADVLFRCQDDAQPFSWPDLLSKTVEKKECILKYDFPGFSPLADTYCEITISECNKTGKWLNFDPDIDHACRTYSMTFIHDGLRFKNVFCAFCNGVETVTDNLLCEQDKFYGTDFSFSGLLKLENDRNGNIKSKVTCSIDELYDEIYNICRELYCPPNKRLQDGKCVTIYYTIVYITYFFNVIVTPLEPTTVNEANDIGVYLEDYFRNLFDFRNYVCDVKVLSKVETNFTTLNAEDIVNKRIKYFITKIEIVFSENHKSDEYVKNILSYHDKNIDVFYNKHNDSIKTFKGHMLLTDQPIELFKQMQNISNQAFRSTSPWGPMIEPIYSLQEFIKRFATAGETSGVLIPHVYANRFYSPCMSDKYPYVVIFKMKPCPIVKLHKAETAWVRVDEGIKIVRGDFVLKHSEFYTEDDNMVIVCSDTYKMRMQSRNMFPFRRETYAEKLVSFICISVSIFSLCVTFISFCLFPKLRSLLPGKNNMFLVLILLGAQSMYLITGLGTFDGGTMVCKVFGIVLHTIWLISMFWMNVCTYHLFHVFTTVTRSKAESQAFRFLFYLLYAIIMSAIPVCINISISLSTSNSLGYGDSVCYISSQTMATYTFGIPTACVVATNFCMFLWVMIKIKRGLMVKNAVNHEHNTLIIFAKLSTNTGITWIFGYFYTWTGIVVFSYLFILFNASQGIFLMIAFIFNYRVRNMIMNEFSSRWQALSRSASTERAYIGGSNGVQSDRHM